MARKTLVVTIDTPGRDHGKAFLLTEMPALQAEKWAMRAFLALARSGIELPASVSGAGLVGLAAIAERAVLGLLGLLGKMQWQDAEPLIDEMMTCVKRMPDPDRPRIIRQLNQDDVEEVATSLLLRKEVFTLHADFTELAGRLS